MHSTFKVLLDIMKDLNIIYDGSEFLNKNEMQSESQSKPHSEPQSKPQSEPQSETQAQNTIISLERQINFINYVVMNLSFDNLDKEKLDILDSNNIDYKIFKKLKQDLMSVVMCENNLGVVLRLMSKDILSPLEKAYLIIRSIRYIGDISGMIIHFCGVFEKPLRLVLIKYMIHVYNLIYVDKIMEFFSTFDNFIIFCRNVCNNKRLIRRQNNPDVQGFLDRKFNKFLKHDTADTDYDDVINKILNEDSTNASFDCAKSEHGLIKYTSITNKVIKILLIRIGDNRIIDHVITNDIYFYEIVIYENFKFLMFDNIKFSCDMLNEVYKLNNQQLISTVEILLNSFNLL